MSFADEKSALVIEFEDALADAMIDAAQGVIRSFSNRLGAPAQVADGEVEALVSLSDQIAARVAA